MTYCNSHKKMQTSKALPSFKLCFQASFHFMEPGYKYVNIFKENAITLRRSISTADPLCLDVILSTF